MRETLPPHTQTHTCAHLVGKMGGSSHCQLFSRMHTESKTITHVDYTCMQMWLSCNRNCTFFCALLCKHVPSPLGASLRPLSTIYTCVGRCSRRWGLPVEQQWEAQLLAPRRERILNRTARSESCCHGPWPFPNGLPEAPQTAVLAIWVMNVKLGTQKVQHGITKIGDGVALSVYRHYWPA